MDQSVPLPVNGKPQPNETRVAGHFGELVQGRLGPDGPVALVSLPCPILASRARFDPAPGPLVVEGVDAAKAERAAAAALAQFAPHGWGGRLRIKRDAPPGVGAGSSTSDALAAWRAVAGAFQSTAGPEEEAAACLAAEGAVDPLMIPGTVLWASRQGRVLERLAPLPPCRIVGGFAGPGAPTDPTDNAFPDMAAVFNGLRAGLVAGDLAAVARAAAQSAEANQARNPNPAWEAVQAASGQLGALGPVVSHTGSAIGLIFPPARDTAPAAAALTRMGLAGVIAFDAGV